MARITTPPALLTGLLLALAACTPRPDAAASGAADSAAAETPAELAAASERVIAGWNGEDAEALAAQYAPEAVVVEGDSIYEGRGAIRDRWIIPGLPVISGLQISGRTYAGNGDTRTETGRYTYTLTLPDSAPMTVTGGYEATWNRQGDEWLIIRESLRNDAPAAP